MKNSYNILVVLVTTILFSIKSYGQGTTCAQADPFCTINSYTFPNNTGTSAEGGNDYGCLSTQPNPAWYYMEIDNSGPIGIGISQQNNSGAGIDVDFILYGPYANLASALSDCGNLGNPGSCSGDHNCSGEIVDCSYDPAATETASIPSAVNGEVYLMLITNYSNQPGQISFEQNSGTGSTNCDIVFPPSCGTVDFHAEENASPYNTINPFPSSMTCEDDWIYLVANDSNTAGGYITPALHFEFTPSNDPNDYVNVYSGGTGALGSGTLIYNGPLNDGIILTLYGEYLSPSTNYYFEICDETSVDYFVYDGGLGTIYASGTDASGAGCTRFGPYSPAGSAGWASSAPGASIGANDAGLMYFDPVVAGPGSYQFQYTWNNGAGCTDTEIKTITVTNPYSFTSLSYSTVCKAAGGTANASLTGTSGGTYSSGTLGASLNTTTGAVNIATAPVGTHTVNYSVGIMPCGATGSGTITIVPDVNPSWTSPGTICEAAGSINLNTLITGTAGGTWSGTGVSGNTFNPAGLSGAISVTYSVGTAPCVETSVQNITVNPDVNPAWTSPGTICEAAGSINLNSLVTGTAGGTWSGTGVSGNTFNPAGLSGAISVTYSVGTAPCVETSVQNITVNPDVNPAWTSPGTICEAAGSINLNLLVTGTAGGTWSGTGVSGNTFNPAGLSGAISVTYSVGTAPCVETSVQNITVNPDVNPAWTSPGAICEAAGSINLNTLITGTAGGAWSGTGVSGNTFNPAGLSGAISVTYSVGTAPCVETSVQNITVNPDVNPAWTSPGTICEAAGSINLNSLVTGTAGGAWSGTGVSGNTFNPAGLSGAISVTYSVGTAPCVETSVQNITVNPDVNPAWTSPGAICEAAGSINLNTLITGTAGGAWSGTGVSGNTFNPAGLSGAISVTYSVGSAPCVETSVQNITVNPDPTIGITTASECENITGSGEALNIDVTALETAINATANITWYTDNTYTTSYNPTNETVSNGEVFYFEVELNGCIVQGTITYSVSGNIVLNDPAPEFCEDVLGGGSVANIDLTTFNNSVFAGATSYTWATGPTGVTINDGDSINVQVTQGSCPTVDIFVHFSVNPLPTAIISGSDTICAGDAIPDVTITLTGTGPWSVTYTDGTTPVTINPATSPATISGLTDGTYTVTAVSDNNCTGTFSGSATILTNPLPTATISGGGTICAGDTIPDVTITLTGTGPWSVTYTDGTTPVTINPATSPVTLSGLADGTYTVTAVSDNNCTGTFSGSATILTNPLPTAIDQNPQVCEDASTPGSAAGVDLTTLNSSIDGGVGNTLTWYTDAGLTLPVGTPTNTTVNDNDVFYVFVDNGTCSDTAVITYDVTSTITLTAQTPSLCEDAVGSGTVANVDLTSYNNAIYSGGATFDWYQDAGLTTPVATPTAVTVTNGLTLYVDVTDGNCNNNSTITFTINPIYFNQESTNICSGASYTFPDGTTQNNITAQVLYNSNLTTTLGCDSIIETTVDVNPTYNIQETVNVCSGGSYTFPDGTTQTNITAQVIYNSNLTTTLGCDSIVETTVDVNPTYFNQESTNICSGGSYTFPDGTTQTNITTQVVYNSNLTTTLGCDSIIETTVNVDPQLTIVAGSVAPICFGENITLTATGSGNGTITWYSDAAGTNVIGTGSPFNATSQVSTTGTYTFYVNEAGTCSSTLTSVNVIVGGVTAAITATPTSGFMPLDVAFTNNSSTGPSVTYDWNFGDGTPNTNATDPTHTYATLGNYTATLIVTDGICSDTATVTIEVIGQSSIVIPNVFTPNGDGSNDVFTVEGTNLESVEGEIFNRWGQKMFEWKHVKGYWDGRTQSGAEAPDGTYFYIIKAKGMDDVEYFKKGGFSLIR